MHLESTSRSADIFKAIRQPMTPPATPKRKIGFHLKEKQAWYGKDGKIVAIDFNCLLWFKLLISKLAF